MSWLQLVPTDAREGSAAAESHPVAVAPSVLACDFSRIAQEVKAVEAAGVEFLHLDVMDGHFVPNISFGPGVVEAINRVASRPLDTHLMISHPDEYIPQFLDAGADILTFHADASGNPARDLKTIRDRGRKCGLVVNPDVDYALVEPHLEATDLFLVMSVFAGFGGQKFMPEVLAKIERAAADRERRGLSFAIEIDGGINAETAVAARDAGVDILVAGTAIFRTEDYARAVADIRGV